MLKKMCFVIMEGEEELRQPILAQVLYIFFMASSMTKYAFLVLYHNVSDEIGLATDEKSGHKTVNTFLQTLYRYFCVTDVVFGRSVRL